MHAALLIVLLATTASQGTIDGQDETTTVVEQGDSNVGYQHGSTTGSFWGYGDRWRAHMSLYCGPMPQTCYAPRFGCYPGNNRYMHRYTAFHGYYYRQPYNYRHLFDYPWHATPHEPRGFFTYQGSKQATEEEGIVPGLQQAGVMSESPSPYPGLR